MAKIMILFASQYGQTKVIANAIKKQLEGSLPSGEAVRLIELSTERPRAELDSDTEIVFVGAPIYVSQYPKPLIRWLKIHRKQLSAKTTGFFSVILNAANKSPKARKNDNKLLHKLIRSAAVVPTYIASFGGALNYLNYKWFTRLIMKWISAAADGPTDTSKNYELTDWSAITSFVADVVQRNQNSPFLTAKRFPREQPKEKNIDSYTQQKGSPKPA